MWKRLISLGFAFFSLVPPAMGDPASISIHSAPPAWVQYANLIDQQLEARLAGDTEPAARLRGYLQTGDRTTIAISVWVDANGVVSKIGFAPFLDSQANADLTTLLQGVKLPSAPPAGILLPIHLKLHLAAGIVPAPSSDK